MGQCWRRIGSAMAIAAMVATPGVLSACVLLCAPVAAGPAAAHHVGPMAVTESTGAAAHAGHASAEAGHAAASARGQLTGAGHDCCGGDAGVLLLTAASTRSGGPTAPAAAPPDRSPWLARAALAGVPVVASRPVPPPSPPPALLVLRI